MKFPKHICLVDGDYKIALIKKSKPTAAQLITEPQAIGRQRLSMWAKRWLQVLSLRKKKAFAIPTTKEYWLESNEGYA